MEALLNGAGGMSQDEEVRTPTAEEMFEEAVSRLEILERVFSLHGNARADFEGTHTVNVSERTRLSLSLPAFGALYWADEVQARAIANFQEQQHALVYHATTEVVDFGYGPMRMLDLFFVSRYTDEWEMDRDELEAGELVAFVVNMDDPWCSEFGTIAINGAGGGILRVA